MSSDDDEAIQEIRGSCYVTGFHVKPAVASIVCCSTIYRSGYREARIVRRSVINVSDP